MRSPMVCWLVLGSVLLVGCSSAHFPDSREVTGTWTGSYTCAQGLTGMRLEMLGTVFGPVGATFDFFPLPESPGVPSGRFAMQGVFTDARVLRLEADESDWIDKPDGYRTVDLDGVISADGRTYSGNVLGSLLCTTFSVVRQ